jgi:hypothetical protein
MKKILFYITILFINNNIICSDKDRCRLIDKIFEDLFRSDEDAMKKYILIEETLNKLHKMEDDLREMRKQQLLPHEYDKYRIHQQYLKFLYLQNDLLDHLKKILNEKKITQEAYRKITSEINNISNNLWAEHFEIKTNKDDTLLQEMCLCSRCSRCYDNTPLNNIKHFIANHKNYFYGVATLALLGFGINWLQKRHKKKIQNQATTTTKTQEIKHKK